MASARQAPSLLRKGADTGPAESEGLPRFADPGAAAWQTEPWFAFARDQYRHGTLPLWNPYQAYGAPLAANMQSQAFYPLTLALLVDLTPRTYNLYLLARLFVLGICAYYYLRLFLSFPAAIGGAIGCMLSGYYIVFISAPHLSVETLIPAVLLAGELVLRRQSYRSVVCLAAVVAVVILGGMPESAALLFSFTAAYLLFRVFSDPELRRRWKLLLSLFTGGSAAGMGLSSFLLLPFYEYMIRSTSPHDPGYTNGLRYDKFDFSVLTYFVPLLFGPMNSSPAFIYFKNYFGLISVFLIVVAIACLLLRRSRTDGGLNSLTLFFSACIAFAILKRFGLRPVNWIGVLPIFRVIDFHKYDEPILACCVWILAAIGIERIRRGQTSRLIETAGVAAASVVYVIALLLARSEPQSAVSHFAIRLSALLMAACWTVMLFSFGPASRKSWWPPVIAAFIAFEMSFNYIVPLDRIYDHLPSVRSNPYAGGAVVRFLQKRDRNNSRLFGRDWVLTPDWASAFQIPDIRDMDGLYYRKYFLFVRNFIPITDRDPTELVGSFLGRGTYDLQLPLEKRLLQLSSIRYLATQMPFVPPSPRIDEILQQNKGRLIQGKENLVGRTGFILNGTARSALSEHPPYERLPYRVRVPTADPIFHFSYALNPAVFLPNAGDGVGFTIELKDASGNIEKLFSNYIDPKHNAGERRWFDSEIDLSRYRGKEITLLFSTDPGPRGDTTFDWAAWSDLRFDEDQREPPPEYSLVYDAEAKVYEYANVLPRTAIYYDTAIEKDDAAVLKKLADPSLDVFRTVVLDSSKLTRQEIEAAARVNERAPEPVEPGRIESYQAQDIEIEASLHRSGILVLNDSDYPGWRVLVDGRPGRWFSANYLFRGVLLDSGTHIVRFEYRPASFYWGVAITLLTLSVVVAFGFRAAKQRLRDTAR